MNQSKSNLGNSRQFNANEFMKTRFFPPYAVFHRRRKQLYKIASIEFASESLELLWPIKTTEKPLFRLVFKLIAKVLLDEMEVEFLNVDVFHPNNGLT